MWRSTIGMDKSSQLKDLTLWMLWLCHLWYYWSTFCSWIGWWITLSEIFLCLPSQWVSACTSGSWSVYLGSQGCQMGYVVRSCSSGWWASSTSLECVWVGCWPCPCSHSGLPHFFSWPVRSLLILFSWIHVFSVPGWWILSALSYEQLALRIGTSWYPFSLPCHLPFDHGNLQCSD